MKPETNARQIIIKKPHKTVYRDGDRLIKEFDGTYLKSNVLNEALNLARVEETGLLVPNMLEVTFHDGKWAIVTEYIEGKTLAQLISEKPKDKKKLITRFVTIQTEVHGKKANHLNKLRDKLHEKISA